jgi:hypothetical protein
MQKVTKLPEWQEQWQRCKPYIEKAVKYQDSYTIDDIEDKIREGLFHLWPGERSAIVTQFVLFPQMKGLNILFCGGGIKRLYGGGRKGWIRKLKHLGFEKEYLIKKDL